MWGSVAGEDVQKDEENVTPCLFDRVSSEVAAKGGSVSFEDYRGLVCRDLEALLNGRVLAYNLSAELVEVKQSYLYYGVSPLLERNLDSDVGRDALKASMINAVHKFEPRLTNVVIDVKKGRGRNINRVNVTIQGILQHETRLQDVMFAGHVEPKQRSLQLHTE